MIPLVLRSTGGETEVRVAVIEDAATVADLVRAATGRPAPASVLVDGRRVPTVTPFALAGVGRGSTVDLEPPPGRASVGGGDAVMELRQIAGVQSGARTALTAGRHLVGSGQPAVGVAVVEVGANGRTTVFPLGYPVRVDGAVAPPGTPVEPGAVVEVAGVAFTLAGPPRPETGPSRLPDLTGTRPLNRPPRLAPPPPVPPVELPAEPDRPGRRRGLPWLSIVVPLPIAVVLALVMRQPYFLLFGLLSPVMLVARFAEERRTGRRDLRRYQSEVERLLAELRLALAAQRAAELRGRRLRHPEIAEVLRRAEQGSPLLWERRATGEDFLRVRLGHATLPWRPETAGSGRALDGVHAVLDEFTRLPAAPLVADLDTGAALGFSGPRAATLPVVRAALLDLVVQHGPADLRVVVLTEPARAGLWEWVKWLPHAVGDVDTPQVAYDEAGARGLLAAAGPATGLTTGAAAGGIPRLGASTREREPGRPTTLVVVDGEAYLRGRSSTVRALLARAQPHVRALVVAEDPTTLPAACVGVVSALSTGGGHYLEPGRRMGVTDAGLAGVTVAAARRTALALAGLEDPERPTGASGLPTAVSLLGLVGLDGLREDPEAATELLARRWVDGGARPSCRVPVGVSETGVFELDPVTDGPHALIAGTTGAGKSELLRTVVAALAALVSPAQLNVVLIDYKGGGAFDACADLPHTVGVVTDLDANLGERALRCLNAEVRYREHLLRQAGVVNLDEYADARSGPPMPRLMVIVDEFATLAAEIPDFLASLVSIAQRGRSLGIHLVLATQRPAGVLDNKIRANTNLRVALRVQDDADSVDVIGAKVAAAIPRGLPGRGYARLGAGELTLFQSAIVSGAGGPTGGQPAVQVVPFEAVPAAATSASAVSTATTVPSGVSDLRRLVTATRAAATALGLPPPRVPWPPPLPARLDAESLRGTEGPTVFPIGLVDLPDGQRQETYCWDPIDDGNLAVYGIVGAGSSTVLATVALAAAHRMPASDLHLYIVDGDTHALSPLAQLPHVGAYIRLDEDERWRRLIRYLAGELDRRRGLLRDADGGATLRAQPLLCLLVDNFGALREAAEDHPDLTASLADLSQVIRDGTPLRVAVAVTAKQERGLPGSLAAVIPKRLVLRLADPMSYSAFGLRAKDIPELGAGRGIDLATGSEVQIAQFAGGDLAAAVTVVGPSDDGAGPPPILALPTHVRVADLGDPARRHQGTWTVPVGIDDRTLGPARLTVAGGDGITVIGPARSGRSTLLRTIAEAVRTADPTVPIHVLAPRRSALADLDFLASVHTDPGDLEGWVGQVLAATEPRWVIVDDADRVAGRALEPLGKHRDDRLTLVVAGRADELKAFTHWAKDVQRSRVGVALRPAPGDGEVFRLSFPGRAPRFPPGRGYLICEGELTTIQVAMA